MPSLRQLNNRIKSVKTTSKLTKAMQAVAAMRLKKYSQKSIAIKKYEESLKVILSDLLRTVVENRDENLNFPYLRDFSIRNSGKTLVVLISPSRGFCGGLHRSVVTETYKNLVDKGLVPDDASQVNFITVNKPAQRLVSKLGGQIIAYFQGPFKDVTAYSLLPISELVFQAWDKDKIKNVVVAYVESNNNFKSTIKYEEILPLNFKNFRNDSQLKEFQPIPETDLSIDDIMEEFLPQWLEMSIHKSLILTQTAEEGARMIAMNQATDNANRLTNKLNLVYFRTRQAKITQEISEIVGGSL